METKDFIGFTYDGKHSDEFGIVRVSDGDRYKEQLQPEIKDLTSEVTGVDGNYYFGSNYGTKEIEINIAYDSLTETQLRDLRKTFGDKMIHRLIFDEQPYKEYLVKIANPIELSYVCFDEQRKRAYGEEETPYEYGVRKDSGSSTGHERIYPWVYEDGTQRIYKGDGTINLIAYYPFAKSVFKKLPSKEGYPNVGEWADTSRILSADNYDTDEIDQYVNGTIRLYNAGDVPTGLRIYYPFSLGVNTLRLDYKINGIIENSLILDHIEKSNFDNGFVINMDTQLIQGVINFDNDEKNMVLSTTLYNRYVVAGNFFKIKPTSGDEEMKLVIIGGNDQIKVFYEYLYF